MGGWGGGGGGGELVDRAPACVTHAGVLCGVSFFHSTRDLSLSSLARWNANSGRGAWGGKQGGKQQAAANTMIKTQRGTWSLSPFSLSSHPPLLPRRGSPILGAARHRPGGCGAAPRRGRRRRRRRRRAGTRGEAAALVPPATKQAPLDGPSAACVRVPQARRAGALAGRRRRGGGGGGWRGRPTSAAAPAGAGSPGGGAAGRGGGGGRRGGGGGGAAVAAVVADVHIQGERCRRVGGGWGRGGGGRGIVGGRLCVLRGERGRRSREGRESFRAGAAPPRCVHAGGGGGGTPHHWTGRQTTPPSLRARACQAYMRAMPAHRRRACERAPISLPAPALAKRTSISASGPRRRCALSGGGDVRRASEEPVQRARGDSRSAVTIACEREREREREGTRPGRPPPFFVARAEKRLLGREGARENEHPSCLTHSLTLSSLARLYDTRPHAHTPALRQSTHWHAS